MNKHYNNSGWDANNSTYMQRIILKNEKTLTGFSKRIGFSEAKNKRKVIQNWILRSFRDGYLDEDNSRRDSAICIEYYWKNDVKVWELAFIVYQNRVVWESSWQNKDFEKFMYRFFELKKQKISPYEKLYSSAKSKPSNPLDLSKFRHRRLEDFRNYCIDLLRKNVVPLGEIKHFYIQYVNKYLGSYKEGDTDFLNNRPL